MMKYNDIKETEIVFFAQQFSSWFVIKNMELEAEGIPLHIVHYAVISYYTEHQSDSRRWDDCNN
jgi:hypothetical protein